MRWRKNLKSIVATPMVFLALVGCASEEEKVVETWESLATAVENTQYDCEALAETLSSFRSDNPDVFSSSSRKLYTKIYDDTDLRVRIERAYARIESIDYECRKDAAVQDAAAELLADFLPQSE